MFSIKRRKTKEIRIGKVLVGSSHPVAIQSMSKTKTSDTAATVSQIKRLKACGCEIVRVAVKDPDDARAVAGIKKAVDIPLVADIHFDWRLAIAAIESGADKIRLNPGNIFKKEQIKEVISAAKSAGIPVRVGLNSGSVKGAGEITARLVRTALDYCRILEKMRFDDIVISLKASSAYETIKAYRKISQQCDYPLHLGVTATGLPLEGMIKSSVAIGSLLLDGIGDTIRISLTEDPVKEVEMAKTLLKSLGLRAFGPEIISCPTCGRCDVDLIKIVRELEKRISSDIRISASKAIKVAVMGCVVNGPGEAKQADIGIAFGKKDGLLFKKGRPVRKINVDKSVDLLLNEINKFV